LFYESYVEYLAAKLSIFFGFTKFFGLFFIYKKRIFADRAFFASVNDILGRFFGHNEKKTYLCRL